MGTTHIIDAQSLLNPCIQKILECSELFTELGTLRPIGSNDGCFPGVEKHESPYPHSDDAFLTIMARWRKIPIIALDPQVPEMQETMHWLSSQRAKLGPEEAGNALTKMFQIAVETDQDTLSAFLRSDLSSLKKIRQETMDAPLRYEREDKWSEILIPKLLETEKPIGIAVGVIHLVGEDSLSERFAKAGLKVELITPKPRSHL